MTDKQKKQIDRLKNDIPDGFEVKVFSAISTNSKVIITREIGRPHDEGTILELVARSCSVFAIGPNGGLKETKVF